MKLSVEGKFRLAVKTALLAGITVGAQGSVYAQEGPATTPATSEESTDLGAIEVTGSRLRRVDTETASPVYTIDRAAIEASGVTTLGELLQEMPSISGAATNPQVNNGGGDGAATVSLRGLGSERTLTLLNGRRLGPSFDVNALPINLIDRVEVLKEGAGAVYGSDAIGGVVNFITRKDYQGFDISYQGGQSSKHDGESQSVEMTWGTMSDKGSLMLGLNYNKQNKIGAGNRKFSKNALYIYNYYGSDTLITLGSSRVPNGRISLPSGHPTRTALGCANVVRNDGASGADPVNDYHCYTPADAYDYQPFNLIVTPQERGSLFSSAAYKLTDSVEAYTDLFHNFTQSGFTIAPLPFDARNDNYVISADSMYNPFGIDFGGNSGANPQFLTRFTNLGNRQSKVETTTDQITAGFKGGFGASSWTWDVAGTYQRSAQVAAVSGYLVGASLQNALGPSFDDNGTPTCGTPDAPISGCTPINIFNLEDPAAATALNAITAGYENRTVQTSRIAEASFSGNLFTWSEGTALAAFGLNYREDFLNADVDGLTEAQPPTFLSCQLSQETCSGDTRGDDNLWEASAELFLPLLTGKPGAQSLNLILGLRYSDYDSFGDTTNGTAKLEWRPVNDLLVRASYAEVFRAPTISDRFGAAGSTAALFSDPCQGLTAADVAGNPNYTAACANVPTDGSFQPENTQISGVLTSSPDLKPETGEVVTYGIVYDPHWLPNFSTSVDLWHYKINDAITSADPTVVARTCIESGDPNFCNLINRYPDGQVFYISLPTTNSAYFETEGVDIGVKYRVPKTPFGSFTFTADSSYTDKFEYNLSPLSAPTDAAGTFDPTFGNYAKWRATASLGWKLNGFEAQWTSRYIDGVDIAASLGPGSARPAATEVLKVGSVTYHDVVVGYTYEPTRTRVLLGMENVFDKQPPLFYQYALNANTNVETYDAIGRYLYFRVSQSF
ncbi:TonB-dependent receptor domain-containing protein [Hydrocarboniphaga sp.]|uniref:TonB-dependent receptor domain-containing protein n=1 Tax=Hydrocarboniphaga sp. TaxID=2033016 RepID=UPI003D0B08E1